MNSLNENLPEISIIVPCYNEERTIRLLLDALVDQTYPKDRMEVVIADGLSTDRTRQVISAFQAEHPEMQVRLVDNPQKTIPAGLNAATLASRGGIIVRLDAHSMPYPDYVDRCVAALEAGLGENVGGVWEIQPGGAGWQAGAIAVAAAHPLGAGDAHYRLASSARAVDTVPFGAFRRSLVETIGAFNENLLTNEDYEFNTRVRKSGGRVWLDPAIRSVYFSRPNLASLFRQYWRYGYWKARMIKLYPGALRWRQMVPPAFVLSLAVLGVAAPFLFQARIMLGIEILIYAACLLVAGLQAAFARREPTLLAGLPLALGIMHIAWGGAFIWSLLDAKQR